MKTLPAGAAPARRLKSFTPNALVACTAGPETSGAGSSSAAPAGGFGAAAGAGPPGAPPALPNEKSAAASAATRAEGADEASAYHQAIDEFRRGLLRKALRAAGGNRAEAARRLGLSRQALSYLVLHLGLEDDGRETAGEADTRGEA